MTIAAGTPPAMGGFGCGYPSKGHHDRRPVREIANQRGHGDAARRGKTPRAAPPLRGPIVDLFGFK
jgi:hypothetical protein